MLRLQLRNELCYVNLFRRLLITRLSPCLEATSTPDLRPRKLPLTRPLYNDL
jgi:hypothetical protein